MAAAVARTKGLPEKTKGILLLLGRELGRFDIDGQIRGLDAVRLQCKDRLNALTQNKETRIRSYKTLGLCAGAAMVILFI
jgi:stage III sporulation protein AB